MVENGIMPTEYVKRLRMRCPGTGVDIPRLPSGYSWKAWDSTLLDVHAQVLLLSFANTLDTRLFPNLRTETGCRMLVRAIEGSREFCPQASWLIHSSSTPVGCVQGLYHQGLGSIQNIAILPEYRARGFGSALLAAALHGYSLLQADTVELEVTEQNAAALSIYRRFGFEVYKTDYRAVDVPDRSMVGHGI
jgi:mycothiol synthase